MMVREKSGRKGEIWVSRKREEACLVVWVLQKRPSPSQARNKHRTVNKKEL